jgi:hypothetical protein
METATKKIDLSDVSLFSDGTPHEAFRLLRHEQPIYWNEQSDGSGFWAITRHADVLAVSRDSELFSNERHGLTACPNQLLDPTDNEEVSLVVQRSDIPRVIPAVLQCFPRGFRIVEVSVHQIMGPQADLAVVSDS